MGKHRQIKHLAGAVGYAFVYLTVHHRGQLNAHTAELQFMVLVVLAMGFGLGAMFVTELKKIE